jgi:hypothetical protein
MGTCLRQAFGKGLRETLVAYLALFDRLQIMRGVMPKVTEEADRMIRLLGWKLEAFDKAFLLGNTEILQRWEEQ